MTSIETPRDRNGLVDTGQVGEQPDPAARPVRRTFTAEYRAHLVAEYEAAPHGQKSAVLRREGLYHSTRIHRVSKSRGRVVTRGCPAV